MKFFTFIAIAFMLAFPNPAYSAIIYYGVRDYEGKADNPFVGNSTIDVVYVETFESQFGRGTNSLTTPHVTAWNGGTTGGPGWGVGEDYNSADQDGWVWADNVGNPEWRKNPSGIHFDFTPDIYGRLPEYAGAALLGRIDQFDTGGLYNNIFVYDKDSNEVTGGLWKLPRPLFSEDKLEDHFKDFEGIYVPGGISRIQFRDFVEVDHLTYGYAPLPEASTLSLAGLAVTCLLNRRSRAVA